jgi:hypothetical protein
MRNGTCSGCGLCADDGDERRNEHECMLFEFGVC